MKLDFNISDFFKLPTKIMIAISIASGMILFLPNSIVEKMYMDSFRNEYGFIIGIVFLISFSILLVTAVVGLYKYFQNKYYLKKFNETSGDRLSKLDDYQKAIVYSLFIEDNKTNELPLNDGAVRYLEYNLMINKATTQYMVNDLNNAVFPYFVQPWVIEKLDENADLLQAFKNSYGKYL